MVLEVAGEADVLVVELNVVGGAVVLDVVREVVGEGDSVVTVVLGVVGEEDLVVVELEVVGELEDVPAVVLEVVDMVLEVVCLVLEASVGMSGPMASVVVLQFVIGRSSFGSKLSGVPVDTFRKGDGGQHCGEREQGMAREKPTTIHRTLTKVLL